MNAFEIKNESGAMAPLNDRVREECIIALKVYDFCRQQDCLTCDALGPARAECFTQVGNVAIQEGDIIIPPTNAATVSVENLKVKKVIVADKEPNPFKNGYWDITLKYVFAYKLIFRESDGTLIGSICANNIFTKKVTLFGSVGTEISISTDLFCQNGAGPSELNSDPFVLVESKAISLNAEIRSRRCCSNVLGEEERTRDICVTIGLFTIVKLFRIANLSVLSRGFCIPRECEEVSPLNACEFFDSLDFPMDIFAPPQKTEFLAGVSGNIPKKSVLNSSKDNCCQTNPTQNVLNSSKGSCCQTNQTQNVLNSSKINCCTNNTLGLNLGGCGC